MRMKRMLCAAAVLAALATALVGVSPANAANRPAPSGLLKLPKNAQELTVTLVPEGKTPDQQRALAISCSLFTGDPFLSSTAAGLVVRVVASGSCSEQMAFIEMVVAVYKGLNPPVTAYNSTIISSGLIGVVGIACPSGSSDLYLGAARMFARSFSGETFLSPVIPSLRQVAIFCP